MAKTFLAQNKFNSDSADAAECEAVANASPPSTATANLSDGVGAKPILASSPSEAAIVSVRAPVAATIAHNPITQAVEIHSSCGEASDECLRTRKQPSMASRLTPPSPQDHISHLIHHAGDKHPDEDEVLYLLLKLHDKPDTQDLPEIPDEHTFLNDVEPMGPFLHFLLTKKSAPRDRAGDPVWADASPLFLQGGNNA